MQRKDLAKKNRYKDNDCRQTTAAVSELYRRRVRNLLTFFRSQSICWLDLPPGACMIEQDATEQANTHVDGGQQRLLGRKEEVQREE